MRVRFGWAAPLAAVVLMCSGIPAVGTAKPPDPLKASPLSPALQALAEGHGLPELKAAGRDGEVLSRRDGRVLVEARLADVSAASLHRLTVLGADIRVVDDHLRAVTIAIDPGRLSALAPLVQSAVEVLKPMVNASCPPPGAAISEGVTHLNVDKARAAAHLDGTDVTVGVISDSFNFLGGQQADVLADELPGSGNPCGHTSNVLNLKDATGTAEDPTTDEGRAMAQIVHDLAPGAHLIFQSGWYGELDMANAIRNLANQGAHIIVDDVTYFKEPMYQDGVIAKAVADVTAQGVTYFSSAGNSSYWQSGANLGSYEAMSFRPAECPGSIKSDYLTGVKCHDFAGGVAPDPTYNVEVRAGGKVGYSLGWNEPMYGVSTDLDLCITGASGELLACDRTNEITTGQPSAYVSWKNTTAGPVTVGLSVVRYTTIGTPRFKLVRNQSAVSWIEPVSNSAGEIIGPSTYGHNASGPGVTVAAAPRNATASVEPWSSWGPARYCWAPVDGTTPAPALTPCQTATIDVTATDGVLTSFFGDGNRFFGTSAAAPHAAAIAALVRERQPCWTPAQVVSALESAGRAMGPLTGDAVGAGLLDATVAVASNAGPKCDTLPPAVKVVADTTWYPTSPAAIWVAAQDKRTVSDITCDNATVSGLTNAGTTYATATLTFQGQGMRTITCVGTDLEGNTGAAPGSQNWVSVGIDMIGPSLACRPAELVVGIPGAVTADVTDPHSGPASPTAVAAFVPHKTGSFLAKVTGADKLGNTSTVTCPYTVTGVAKLTGKRHAKVKIKTPYVAEGFPARVPVHWTVRHAGDVVTRRKDKANAQGESSMKLTFGAKGRYVVKAESGTTSATLTVVVKAA